MKGVSKSASRSKLASSWRSAFGPHFRFREIEASQMMSSAARTQTPAGIATQLQWRCNDGTKHCATKNRIANSGERRHALNSVPHKYSITQTQILLSFDWVMMSFA